MNKLTVLILLIIFTTISCSKAWPAVEYDEVKAFHWPVEMNTSSLIDKDFKLLPGTVNEKGVSLSKDQINSLLMSVTGNHPKHTGDLCYKPHNAFIFYNSQKPVAFLEICFDCQGYRSFPEGAAENWDLKALMKLCQELKIPYGKNSLEKK